MPFMRVILLCAVVAIAGRTFAAGEPDAAAVLAGLIDQAIEARLSREGVQPAAIADDAEFLRRVYLDLHGVIPTSEQAERFLTDSTPAKRARLVDDLLASPRYGEYLADVWQGYLISPLADDRRVRADRFRQWLAGRFNTATWDRITSDLLTGTGKMEDNPAVTYLIEGRLPRGVPDLTDLTSRYFMGVRLNCAQCHDHPFVGWKQQDFWGMAAFFTQVQTPRRAKQVYELGVIDDPKVTLTSLRDAGMLDGFIPRSPTFLGGQEMPAGKGSNRAALSAWLTAADNPYFSRAMANRTWWRLFGRGIVQPVDDMHQGNPPSHPELLDLLARRFAESGFDLKFLTRSIVLSRAYQRTSRAGDAAAGEQQVALFGRMSIKVLSAGQLYDSLEVVSGPAAKVTGIDARQGARPEFTEFFGDEGDPDPTAYRRGIPHLLRQMNSGQFAGRGVEALVSRLSASPGRSGREVASDLFLTILSRRPTAEEEARVKAYLSRSGDVPQAGYRELAWVLIMTSEFSLNH
ncbi:DUF1549 and DUF1553 domain-containing protein [Humisphaera borealis]|uniref:DUF1553 domain-containing protein n=1 Tax=Humisphaera borealis TaxID=2807512 RepID=A0A7M2WSX3_9BACT|nr:DUF1549 and DUF1553 domain-containing protein [Humisphaera borealis]QOV88282.1 DUF1553 domain-containing protein [Humisphaera borealis]